MVRRLYGLGIRPDWWKLEGQPSAAAWDGIAAAVRENDPFCRGIMLLGLDAPLADLRAQFERAAPCPLVKGFAVGRTIFGEPARAWLAGRLTDAEVRGAMAGRFAELVEAWRAARPN